MEGLGAGSHLGLHSLQAVMGPRAWKGVGQAKGEIWDQGVGS